MSYFTTQKGQLAPQSTLCDDNVEQHGSHADSQLTAVSPMHPLSQAVERSPQAHSPVRPGDPFILSWRAAMFTPVAQNSTALQTPPQSPLEAIPESDPQSDASDTSFVDPYPPDLDESEDYAYYTDSESSSDDSYASSYTLSIIWEEDEAEEGAEAHVVTEQGSLGGSHGAGSVLDCVLDLTALAQTHKDSATTAGEPDSPRSTSSSGRLRRINGERDLRDAARAQADGPVQQ